MELKRYPREFGRAPRAAAAVIAHKIAPIVNALTGALTMIV